MRIGGIIVADHMAQWESATEVTGSIPVGPLWLIIHFIKGSVLALAIDQRLLVG